MDEPKTKQNSIIASNTSRVRPKKPLLIGIMATIIVAVAVIVVVIFLIGKKEDSLNNPGSNASDSSSQAVSSDDPEVLNKLNSEDMSDINAARESAMNYQTNIIERMTASVDDDFGYEQARDEYAKKVDSLSGIAQFYYGIKYSDFYFVWGYSKDTINTVLNEAVKIAQKYEPLATNDFTRIDYLVNLLNIYTNAGKATEAEVYRREIEKLQSNDGDGEG